MYTKISISLIVFCLIVFALTGCTDSDPYKQLHAHYISSENGQIEYYRFGKGPPMVLIPGYATDISSWDKKFLSVLAENHEVIVFNNRNVGGSWAKSSEYECKDLANDTYALIQGLNLKKPVVVGISMGGMIAQQLGILHPEAVGELVLINTVIAGPQAIHPPAAIQKRLLTMPKHKIGRYIRAINMFFPYAWRIKMAVKLITERFQPKNYIEINPAQILKQQQHLVMDWIRDTDAADKLHKLSLPVLILNGESDMVIPPRNSVVLAHVLSRALLVRWKEGGHAMIYQFPEQIAETINHFTANTDQLSKSGLPSTG